MKRIKENIKEALKELKEGYKKGYTKGLLKYNSKVKSLVGNIKLDNDLMKAHGMSVSMLYKDENSNYSIIIDKHFKELSQETREFVILHELGHYMLGGEFGNYDFDEDYFQDENKADLFAYNYVGSVNGEKAMKELYSFALRCSEISATSIAVRMGMLGINIDDIYINTVKGKLYANQFHLIFEGKMNEIIFK